MSIIFLKFITLYMYIIIVKSNLYIHTYIIYKAKRGYSWHYLIHKIIELNVPYQGFFCPTFKKNLNVDRLAYNYINKRPRRCTSICFSEMEPSFFFLTSGALINLFLLSRYLTFDQKKK